MQVNPICAECESPALKCYSIILYDLLQLVVPYRTTLYKMTGGKLYTVNLFSKSLTSRYIDLKCTYNI